MKALVVGYGSIGARHARILTELGCHTAVVSRRENIFPSIYSDLSIALASESPDLIVIANETSAHIETLETLMKLGYSESVLVEKPLFSNSTALSPLPFSHLGVAYNLRFHPIIKKLKNLLSNEKILSVQAYVGQYLPLWRPNTDYRTCYSSNSKLGGGALRDISHELDYLLWILGGWNKVVAVGGHFSNLEIDSDDIFSIMLDTPACPVVSLQMNYLDRVGRRFLLINTTSQTIEVDLVKSTLAIDNKIESYEVARDDTYQEMHISMLNKKNDIICSLTEGLDIITLIEAAELSSNQKKWISR